LLLLLIATFASCKKEKSANLEPPLCTNGTLKFTSRSLGGAGWVLQEYDTSTIFYVLEEKSIPNNFQTIDLKISLCIRKYTDSSLYRVITINKR
jgi:hypothetical protein